MDGVLVANNLHGVLRIEFTLPSDPIGSHRQVDGRVLLVDYSCRGAIDLNVADIQAAGNIPCQAVVAEEGDLAECGVMVPGQLALGQDHGA